MHTHSCTQEQYLPHIMNSKLKLACSERDDPNFSSFLDKALLDTKQRCLLESEYSKQLALYCILKDDLDRARYYTGLCLQSFLQVCIFYKINQSFVKTLVNLIEYVYDIYDGTAYLSWKYFQLFLVSQL